MFKKFLLKRNVKKIQYLISKLSFIPKFNERIESREVEHVWQNKTVKSWLHSHGIEISNTPSFAKGGSGIAYFLPKEMVVKVTDDIVEANIAKMLISSKFENNLIDVKKIDNYYLILQHKLDTTNISKEIKTAADLVTVMIDEYELEEFPNDLEKIKQMCLKVLKDNNFSNKYLEKMMIIIQILNKIYQQTGFFHDDAGPTNIGMKNGNTYVFDYGPNKTKQYTTNKAMDKINKQREKLGLNPHNFN